MGGRFEYAFTRHLVGRGEYLYADYGSVTLFGKDRTRTEFRNEMHLVRVGASYRFSSLAPEIRQRLLPGRRLL